jgi:putative transposase
MQSVRRLPHVYPEDRWLFLTWHLRGALRPSQFPPPDKTLTGEAFVLIDRALDTARAGPMYLRQDAIANVVAKSLYTGVELDHYKLASFVIMANHVHALLLPKVDAGKLMKSLKGFTAREANRLLGRTGTPFWQKESYDHWVRDEAEWSRIVRYIENNPVKAGLVSVPEAYRWSSAFGGDTSVDAARLGARATSAAAIVHSSDANRSLDKSTVARPLQLVEPRMGEHPPRSRGA